MKPLVRALSNHPSITSLGIDDWGRTRSQEEQVLLATVASNTRLVTLECAVALSHPEAVEALADAIRYNSTLQKICKARDVISILPIIQALRDNGRVLDIDLDQYIGTTELPALVELLSQHQYLFRLSVYCDISALILGQAQANSPTYTLARYKRGRSTL